MKKVSQLFILACVTMFSSCLKHDLPKPVETNQNNITDFVYLYKYVDTTVVNAGTPNEQTNISVRTLALNNVSKTISNDTIYIKPTFPSGLALKQKLKINLSNIWASATIPNAARIAPVGTAPVLGTQGNYSAPVSYMVTAADGSVKKWTIVTTPLPPVSAYEGAYIESGTLTHSSSGLQNCPANYEVTLETVSANTVKATAGYWFFNNPGITYFITVNPDNSVTISADPAAVVVVQQEAAPASVYDPATKKFTLNYYYYSGGNPANWRKFQTVFTRKP